jgi:hypothetical protein
MRRRSRFNFEAFLDGLTGAGLFAKLRWPGAPKYFVDPAEHSMGEIAGAAALLLQPPIATPSGSSPTRVTATGQRS